jgi:hypothetical protein
MRPTNPEPYRRVPLVGGSGAVTMPSFTVAVWEAPGAHTVELTIALSPVDTPNGEPAYRPDVEKVTLLRNPDLPPITSSDLRRVPIERLLRSLVEAAATGEADEIADAAASMRRRRHDVTPELLRRVATIHGEGGWKAVKERLAISRSQAFRLVAMARQAGLIQPNQQEEPS